MRTWSAEELFIRAYSAAAVGVQAVLDAGAALERMTRPPRRMGHDWDVELGGVHVADGADWLAEKESQEECSEPGVEDYIRATAQAVGLDADEIAGKWRERAEYLGPYEDPNTWEPRLDDDELVAVRGLLQERYGDQSLKADRLDAEQWRAYVGARTQSPFPADTSLFRNGGQTWCMWCNAKQPGPHTDTCPRREYCNDQQPGVGYLCTRTPSHEGEHVTTILGEDVATWPTNFAGAAASLADGMSTPQGLASVNPSVREDKQPVSVDPHTPSSVGSASGPADSPAEECDHSPASPSAGRPAWSDLADAMVNHKSVPAAGDGVATETATPTAAGHTWADLRPQMATIINNHLLPYIDNRGDDPIPCECGAKFDERRGYARHIANQVSYWLDVAGFFPKPYAPQMETGQDMGASHATEFYPQHTKRLK